MKKELGIWIDHREAVIVLASVEDAEVKRIESGAEKQVQSSSNTAKVKEEDIRDRRLANYLHKYYDDVIAHIRDADSILIMGPGEAKVELKKRLESQHLGERIINVESADKMTERQIAAKVREHFSASGKSG